ncbi:MAG: SGNH/GDSL hydrolase family protein [Planctomycetaceae bacterium]|nr:SGNH/GDSL hydrolase family protein [Planctomycetales bacterium]MCB9921859.1 SGNH/GDSL hydrolase family protein [Planctomycetaceae bacterium]
MKRLPCFVLTILLTAHFVVADEPIRERIEWADIWVTDADKDDLPRVLLIGDSITRGYFGDVEKHLAGKAYCARLTTSKCVSDPSFIDEVQLLLKHYRFAVIHFNNGLHGWGYTEDQYRDGLVQAVGAIRKQAGDAKLVWATTTPVRLPNDLTKFGERTERVKVRNQIAAEIMKGHGVSTDDLFGLVENHPDWYSGDGTHFNGTGKEAQAKRVAESVATLLSAEGPSGK